MNRGKKFYLVLGTIVLNAVTFALSTTFITLSWFNKGFNIEFNKQTGLSEANYFASGDGTKDNPYTITTPRHYYNFAWLQYLGEFNKRITDEKTGKIKIDQKYFKLDDNIDMSGYVVPPVGTSEYEFVGNFNGGGNVINNLKVSNNFADFGARHPSVVNETSFNEKNINILGTFGVVGNNEVNDENKRDLYYFNENAIDTPINCIQNLYLDNVTITSTSNQLLIGIIAGYADGVIKTCGVHYATFDINGETSHISNNGIFKDNTLISNYTLLGAYNKNRFYWDGEPGFDGTVASWGDSISMLTLYRRIAYMTAGEYGDTNYSKQILTLENYNLRVKYGRSDIPNYNENLIRAVPTNLYKGTYLPLAVDTSESFEGAPTSSNSSNPTTSFYRNYKKEKKLITNSGYIVGGENEGSFVNPGVVMRLQPLKTGFANSYDVQTEIYDGNKLKMYTVDTTVENPQSVLIDNTVSENLIKYKEVKELFDKSMEGMNNITGFHFFNYLDANKKTKVDDKTIEISNTTYDSYEFIDSALNFTVKEPGYITSINGTFFTDEYQSLFDLYYIERNKTSGDKKTADINRIRKISKIEKDNAKGMKYTFSDGTFLTYSDFNSLTSKTVFDFEKVSNKAIMTQYKTYYYEIPVMPGDYAIGKGNDYKKNDNAYIMYLDIGADSKADDKSGEALEYIDFVSKDANGIQKMDANYVTSKIGFKISDIDESTSFNFRRLGNIVYFYTADNHYKFISQALAIPDGFQIKQAKSKDCNSAK